MMASKVIAFVVFACFLGCAYTCTYDSDCYGLKSCCSDYVCRSSCYICASDADCGYGECCDGYDCSSSYCPYISTGGIAGIIVGTVIFIAIIASIVACFCCACCPYYRYRHPGTVVITGQPPYQPFVSTTTTTSTAQQQPLPPPPGGYGQPPPYYPPQQAGPYPPSQAQGQAAYPAYQAGAGQPVMKQR